MLDIATERGQQTLAQERRVAEIVEATWPGSLYFHTPKETAACIDAVIVRDDIIAAVAETKCRDMTREQLARSFDSEWLVTFDKLVKGEQIASALFVEFWGLVYLVPSDVVLRVKLWSPARGWLVPFRVAKTQTQATVNGGTAIRDNAYVDMRDATVLTGTFALPAARWKDRPPLPQRP